MTTRATENEARESPGAEDQPENGPVEDQQHEVREDGGDDARDKSQERQNAAREAAGDLENPGIEDMSWPERAARIANVLAHYPVYDTGGLAELRRLNPEDPDGATFWRLMNRYQLGRTPENEVRWATILQGIAIMTPNSNTEQNVKYVHLPWMTLGEAMFNAGDRERTEPVCSEGRMYQMLDAREASFRRHLIAILRQMAQQGVRMDCRELARLVLDDGKNRDRRTDRQNRQNVSRSYFRTEARAKQPRRQAAWG